MRRYGNWAGFPQGHPEDTRLCIVQVWPVGRSIIPYQCGRKRGHGPDGLYCAQHAKTLAVGQFLSVPEDKPESVEVAK